MRTSIFHLEALEGEGYIPLNAKDKKIIQQHINNKIDIWYGDDLKVWSEAGIYIADLKEF